MKSLSSVSLWLVVCLALVVMACEAPQEVENPEIPGAGEGSPSWLGDGSATPGNAEGGGGLPMEDAPHEEGTTPAGEEPTGDNPWAGTPDSEDTPSEGGTPGQNDSGTPDGGTPTTGEGEPNGGSPADSDEVDDLNTGLSCSEVYDLIGECYAVYYDCASACEDQACGDACGASYNACHDSQVALGSPQAQTDFNALRLCEDTHWDACYADGGEVYESCASSCADQACADACGEDANVVLQNCMVDACAAEFATCGVTVDAPAPDSGGSGSGAGSSELGISCGELYECEDGCNGSQVCGQACYDSGSPTAQQQWTDLILCGNANCGGQTSSATQYKACLQQECNIRWINKSLQQLATNTGFGQTEDSSGGLVAVSNGAPCIDAPHR